MENFLINNGKNYIEFTIEEIFKEFITIDDFLNEMKEMGVYAIIPHWTMNKIIIFIEDYNK